MSDFSELAKQAESDPDQMDFAALREAYVQSDIYRPAKHILQSKLMQITNAVKGFEEVAQTCRNILDANPMDLEARMLLGLALEKLGDQVAAEKHHTFANRMIDAILATGDGKALDTAWKVIAEAEPWTVMKVFGMKTTSHSRHVHGDLLIDVFEGRIEEREVKMHFDVTIFVKAIEELIGSE